ncbi:hypothetical protein GCM10007913_11580 [Devosia yakushimensis]|uniref:Uncharacterized protein n=1 Tax=Devosia yakushimensis TaxID=470028 RepID=A0ABQ5UBK5_9HYPH|nr:hypothetical protein [Devosia yakushimensis]GLQ09226.1 hypothetical protein GCM10007913_11580 [Devosia yakushimensis]
MAKLTQLDSVEQVTAVLGGVGAVQDLTQAASSQVVSNWVARGRFAHHAYLVMTKALEELGYSAPPELWGITAPAEPATASSP